MASNGQRVAAFSLALLFLLSSVGLSAYLIWELFRDDAVLIEENAIASLNENTQTQDQTTLPEEETVADDAQELQIIDNFDGPIEVPELRFDVLTEGEADGDVVEAGDTVTIHYTGALASDGTVFDSSVSRGEPAQFPLDSLIEGWQEGIPGMKVGERRRLYIPSAQGYGEAGSGASIPPNADLIFDIELFATER